jgi:hypothetical protein
MSEVKRMRRCAQFGGEFTSLPGRLVGLLRSPLRRGLVFAAHSTGEFQRVNGLILENWREAA